MIISASCLLLLSPLIILISLAIVIDSQGSVLCRRRRYNSNNVEFYVFEFRTTTVNFQSNTPDHHLDDARCTTLFGCMLRNSRINKIPLLINVLRGDLSIVGSHLFNNDPVNVIPPFDLGDVKPGLISLTPLYNDEAADANNTRIDGDRYYVKNLSLLLDMKIIIYSLSKNARL